MCWLEAEPSVLVKYALILIDYPRDYGVIVSSRGRTAAVGLKVGV